jgi:hypothetical protein
MSSVSLMGLSTNPQAHLSNSMVSIKLTATHQEVPITIIIFSVPKKKGKIETKAMSICAICVLKICFRFNLTSLMFTLGKI